MRCPHWLLWGPRKGQKEPKLHHRVCVLLAGKGPDPCALRHPGWCASSIWKALTTHGKLSSRRDTREDKPWASIRLDRRPQSREWSLVAPWPGHSEPCGGADLLPQAPGSHCSVRTPWVQLSREVLGESGRFVFLAWSLFVHLFLFGTGARAVSVLSFPPLHSPFRVLVPSDPHSSPGTAAAR